MLNIEPILSGEANVSEEQASMVSILKVPGLVVFCIRFRPMCEIPTKDTYYVPDHPRRRYLDESEPVVGTTGCQEMLGTVSGSVRLRL